MTLSEFGTLVADMKPGHAAKVPYEIFAELFPPGHWSVEAREAADSFAETRGLLIDDRPEDEVVWFVRP